LAVVGGERDVHRVGRVGRRVEGDDEQARVAGLLHGGVDASAHRGDEDPLVTAGDGVLDRGDLPLVIALLLAGGDGQLDVVLGGIGLGALLHGDKERVRRVFGDQAHSHGGGLAAAAGVGAAGAV